MADCTGLETRGRLKGRPARSNRAASFLPVWRNGGRGGLRGRSERVRVQVSRPVFADLAEQADAPDLKPGGATRVSSMLAIGIDARSMQLVLYVWLRGEAGACRASSRRFESAHVLLGTFGRVAQRQQQ